jgi:Secretion system C-terminal sorting domain
LPNASLIPLNTDIKASINSAGDNDYYKFNIPRAGIIKVSVSNVPANIDMDYEFFNELGVSLGSTSYSDGENFSREGLFCNKGTYAFRLADDEGNPNQYTVRVDFDTTDVYECNNEYNSATNIKVCDTITGIIRSLGDSDYYKFNVSSSGIVKVRLLEVPSNIDMQMGVANLTPATVGNIIYANVGQGISADIPLPSSGDYYFVLLDRNNNASSPNKYKFRLEKGCTTSTDDDIINLNFRISPNPTNDRLSLNYTEGSIQTATITDLAGRIFIQKPIRATQADIDVSSLSCGLYLISIETTDGRRGVQKFIKN